MLLAVLLAAAAPTPSDLRTFRDWIAGCDNGRLCQAVALMPEDGAEGAVLALKRGPEADAVPEIWVTMRTEGAAEPAYLGIDGQRFALTLGGSDESPRVRDGIGAARRLGQATRIEALDAAGRSLGPVSAHGSAAALLYLDAQQRRLGAPGALVRRGSAGSVPPPPSLPIVTSPPASSRPPRTLTQARIRTLLGRDVTVCEYAQDMDIITGRLDARTSLVLASHPCGNGAYNLFGTAFLVDERGRAAPARFDTDRGMGEPMNAGVLVNAGWDASRRRLSSYAKARGLGDCGTIQDFAWDGTRFRLVEQQVMGECRGSTDYITTWRARVVPGR